MIASFWKLFSGKWAFKENNFCWEETFWIAEIIVILNDTGWETIVFFIIMAKHARKAEVDAYVSAGCHQELTWLFLPECADSLSCYLDDAITIS